MGTEIGLKTESPGVAETVARGISLTVRPTTSLTALLLLFHVVDRLRVGRDSLLKHFSSCITALYLSSKKGVIYMMCCTVAQQEAPHVALVRQEPKLLANTIHERFGNDGWEVASF